MVMFRDRSVPAASPGAPRRDHGRQRVSAVVSGSEGSTAPGWRLACLWSIPLRGTVGFVLIMVWLTVSYSRVVGYRFPELGGGHWLFTSLMPAGFAASLLLHELGHALAGYLCGLRARWIVLDGLGGETEFERDATTPGRSALVAAAGPAASAVLATALGALSATAVYDSASRFVLTQLALGNAILAVFNLLPGMPLDGGYLLRAVVWRLTGSGRAGTLAAAASGLLTAAALFVVPLGLVISAGARPGLFGIGVLLLIAFPIAGGAWSVLRAETAATGASPTAQDLARAGVAIEPARTVHEAIHLLTAHGAAALAVIAPGGAVLGLVGESEMGRVAIPDRTLVPIVAISPPLHPSQVIPATLGGQPLREHVIASGARILLVTGTGRQDLRILLADEVPGLATLPCSPLTSS